jgi:hypothetical protein
MQWLEVVIGLPSKRGLLSARAKIELLTRDEGWVVAADFRPGAIKRGMCDIKTL